MSLARIISAGKVQRAWLSALLLAASGGCGRQAVVPPPTIVKPAGLKMVPQPVGAAFSQPPWIAHVTAIDLDHDGHLDILACEAKANQVLWLRQTAPGVFKENVIATDMRAPVHVEAVDMDGDGDLDVLVASMSVIFPDNDRIGTVFILENDGHQNFTPHIVLENTARVSDVRGADLNGDGRLDLVLGQFGYDQGEISWLERTGPWEFQRHVLLELSGAINVAVADFNGDGKPDIAAQISQQWEEIHVFFNEGGGRFSARRVWGSTNEDYGCSGMVIADLNRDGRPDLVFSNGDGFGPASTPGPRPWHGVQWLENTGGGTFKYHRIGNLPGAYSPVVVDLDGDGALDVLVSAAYADWGNKNRNVVSLMWFRNIGNMDFAPVALAREPRDLITLAAGDFEGKGRISLVTGGFYVYPPYDAASRIMLWRRDEPKP
jgi:hypothetical protein